MLVYKKNEYIPDFQNIENKTIHNYINELGTKLSDYERDDARFILNYLYLNGRDDYWICIAFIRILGKGNFSQWKYLLNYDPFIKETDEIYRYYIKNMKPYERLKELDSYCGFGWDSERFKDISEEDDDNLCILVNDLIDKDKDTLNNYTDIIDYYFYKYYLSADMIKTHLQVIYYAKDELTPFDIKYKNMSDEERAQWIKDGWLRG